MLPLETIITLLRDKIGLEVSSIGRSSVESAVRDRMSALQVSAEADYARLLGRDLLEQQALIERIVVPETWFFREIATFRMLEKWVRQRMQLAVRVLSAPCATGEEPYSIAMSLLDFGIKPEIEGVDISARALEVARNARYTRNSFRGADLAFRDRFFRKQEDGTYALEARVKECVRFEQANLLQLSPVLRRRSYDIIFCRNLTIYMNEPSRRKALTTLRSFLKPGGLIFAGHAEFQIMAENGFVRSGEHRAFAFVPRAEESPAQNGVSVSARNGGQR